MREAHQSEFCIPFTVQLADSNINTCIFILATAVLTWELLGDVSLLCVLLGDASLFCAWSCTVTPDPAPDEMEDNGCLIMGSPAASGRLDEFGPCCSGVCTTIGELCCK